MLYLGTSGFSYDDWVGNFYPAGLPRHDWLAYYAREFNTCEINSTYYAVPKPSVLKAMADKTGKGFLFSIKANKEMTHQRENNTPVFTTFCEAMEPMASVGKLGCVLAQFPYSFYFNRTNWQYLASFKKQLGEFPLVIEFRNAHWLRREVFNWLREQDIGFCCVDEPRLPNLLPPIAEVTGKIAYLRFHGWNSAKWWQHEQSYERYDYSYTPEELKERLPGIQKLNSSAEKTFIFANNHWRGQAVSTIRHLRIMLD